jgi:GntR family transcriptional regulator/MocR family aminotransferase
MRDSLFHISKSEYASLQAQIREFLVAAILEGRLDPDEPLPSTRKMAKTLGVSRNTVVLAYQALVDDGYLNARSRSGFYVSAKILEGRRPAQGPREKVTAGKPVDWGKRLRIRPAAQDNILKPLDWQSYTYPFIYGQVDHDLFPIAEWRDCSRQALGKRWLGSWTNDIWAFDDPLLIEQIRRRILPRRGIHANEDEILVTLGAQNALYLIASLLVSPETTVAVEEPGYPDVRNNCMLRTRRIHHIPVDGFGMPVTGMLDECDLVFLTPSHQFPTTATMPIERRVELLRRASQKNFVIVEDDYEFETNYVGESCPALKSLDEAGRVIYIGSLSKSLFPGLRLGFMVGPKELVEEARALRRLMVRHAPNNNQRTAALFLQLGHHDALINRLHRIYHTRWQTMGAALEAHLPGAARVPTFGGTAFWVAGPDALDSEELARAAARQSILIEPGRVHFGARIQPRNYFRLGFSSIHEDRIAPGIEKLAGVMDGLMARQAAE